MKKIVIVAVMMVSAVAFADGAKLTCPAGTRQVGGLKSAFEADLCIKVMSDGSRIFHGPYIAYWPNGQQQAVGQHEEGWQVGHWVFFDANGVKTGDTDFIHGQFHGKRIQYWGNGKVMMEEQYDHGRQLSVKTFDQNGAPIAPQQLGVQVRK